MRQTRLLGHHVACNFSQGPLRTSRSYRSRTRFPAQQQQQQQLGCIRSRQPCQSRQSSSRQLRHQRGGLLILAAVKVSTDKNVVCSKTLVGVPGQEKKLHKLCQDITKFSQQRMSDRQSGILQFECSQDNWEPNVVHFWERYVGNAKLGEHSTSSEMKRFMEKARPQPTIRLPQPQLSTFPSRRTQ